MIGMQYKIALPDDYDMERIIARVRDNGHKTDGFEGLLFKCYLIKDKRDGNIENMYAPLYIWKTSEGVNKFLFEGYYDNILKSFGWQHVNIGIPMFTELTESFSTAKYVVEEINEIVPAESLNGFVSRVIDTNAKDSSYAGRVCIYNPDKWNYSVFCFYQCRPTAEADTYRILHISQ